MKKIKITYLLLILILKFGYSQNEVFFKDKKLSTWGEIKIDNVGMNNVSFSIDEKHLAAAGKMGSLIIWNLENGNIEFDLSDTTLDMSYFIRDIDYSPDGKYLATVGSSVYLKSKITDNNGESTIENKVKAIERKVLRIYETSHYSIIKEFTYDTIADMFSCTFSPNSKFLITGENQSNVNSVSILRVYDTKNWKKKSSIEIDYIPWEICFNSLGNKFYTGSSDGFLMKYDFNRGKFALGGKIKLSKNEISSISVSSDDKTLSINEDSLFLYRIDGKKNEFINYKEYRLFACSFASDEDIIAIGGDSNNCLIYNLNSKEIIQELQGDTHNVYQNEGGFNSTRPIFSDSGEIIAMLNDAGMIYIYVKK